MVFLFILSFLGMYISKWDQISTRCKNRLASQPEQTAHLTEDCLHQREMTSYQHVLLDYIGGVPAWLLRQNQAQVLYWRILALVLKTMDQPLQNILQID